MKLFDAPSSELVMPGCTGPESDLTAAVHGIAPPGGGKAAFMFHLALTICRVPTMCQELSGE